MKFCEAFCACCPPLPSGSPRERAPPRGRRPEPCGSVALTVRLLSGEPLVELSVGEHLRANELRAEVEARASARLASEGCFVRSLLWHSTELEGGRTLQEVGVRGGEHDMVAILVRAIEGDFERFRPGCPTCDHRVAVARFRFEPCGVATLSATYPSGRCSERTFRYTLGPIEEGDHGRWAERPLRRSLRLQQQRADGEEPEGDQEAPGVFEGWLELDAADPIDRRLCVEGLNVDADFPRREPGAFGSGTRLELEDVRSLRRRGEDEAQMRVRMLLQLSDERLAYRDERSEEELEYAAHVMVADTPTWAPTNAVEETRMYSAPAYGHAQTARMYRRVFGRPRCASERMLRDRRPKLRKPRHGRRSHCLYAMPCKGRGCHWVCRHHGDTRAETARLRSATRRSERAFKAEWIAA